MNFVLSPHQYRNQTQVACKSIQIPWTFTYLSCYNHNVNVLYWDFIWTFVCGCNMTWELVCDELCGTSADRSHANNFSNTALPWRSAVGSSPDTKPLIMAKTSSEDQNYAGLGPKHSGLKQQPPAGPGGWAQSFGINYKMWKIRNNCFLE